MREINLIGFAVICCLAAVLVADRKTNVGIAAAKTSANNAKVPAWAKVSKEQIAEAKKLGVPVAFENSDGMKFVLVPAAQFMMGSTKKEKDGDKDEKPAHEVVISKPFHLGMFEVTCAQWKLVMGTLPKDAGDDPAAAVSGVSWEQCQTFIRKLRELGFGTFRLPTEAEWEYACRAGTTTRFYWGDDPKFAKAGDYAWHKGNAGGRARPVGQKKPNAWGLYDMSGNAWEWCSDWYGPYPSGRQVNPVGPETGKTHVMRGNGWRWGPKYCRSANRFYRAKGHATGLRLVLVQKGKAE